MRDLSGHSMVVMLGFDIILNAFCVDPLPKHSSGVCVWYICRGVRRGGGVQGVQVNPPIFKLIIFIEWLGMHV